MVDAVSAAGDRVAAGCASAGAASVSARLSVRSEGGSRIVARIDCAQVGERQNVCWGRAAEGAALSGAMADVAERTTRDQVGRATQLTDVATGGDAESWRRLYF